MLGSTFGERKAAPTYASVVSVPTGNQHVPPHVWTDKSNLATRQDEGEDAELCALCCHKRSTVTVCGECKEHDCSECIDTHTYGNNVMC